MENFENQERQEFTAQEPVSQEPVQQEPVQQTPVQQEPAYQQPREAAEPNPQPQTYHGAGTGRKESPFANSPYVMQQERPAQNAYQVPMFLPFRRRNLPAKPKRRRKRAVRFGKPFSARF